MGPYTQVVVLSAALVCLLACAQAAATDTWLAKLGAKARATYLNMEEGQRDVARANLKHVSEADQGNVILLPNGVIGILDNFDNDDHDDDDEDGTRQRRSSFDATPEGFSSSGKNPATSSTTSAVSYCMLCRRATAPFQPRPK